MSLIQEIRRGTGPQSGHERAARLGGPDDLAHSTDTGRQNPVGRLGPREVRSKRFSFRRFGRRGCDPDEVRGFLGRVAAEIIALRAELAGVRAENIRMRAALAQWQARYAAWPEPVNPVVSNSSRRYGRA